MRKAKAAFIGFGEVNSPWEMISGKCADAAKRLEEAGIEIAAAAVVRDDPQGKDAAMAVRELTGKEFDLLVLCIAGWIPSHAVIGITARFPHKPMLLWGLAGHLENGKLITTADQAGTSALRKTMEDMGYRFKFVYSRFNSEPPVGSITAFAKAAMAAGLLRTSKIGMMGFHDMNLYGTLYDGVSLRREIGVEVEFFEMLEIVRRMEALSEADVSGYAGKVREKWAFEKPAREGTVERGVRFFLAIRDKAREKGYEAVSLIDVDGMKKLEHFPPSMVFSLLTDEENVCAIPENDTLGAVTQLIVRHVTGQIAAYMELYEFMEDRLLAGVPDFVPAEIIDGPVKVDPARFGGLGEGILNVSRVKTGRVTLCRLAGRGERYTMHIVTGLAVEPRPWEEAGWQPPAPQLPGLEVLLDVPVEDFAGKVLSQHYILSYGDNSEALKNLCGLLGIEAI